MKGWCFNRIGFSLILMSLLAACKKDGPSDDGKKDIILGDGINLLIGCEGNFQFGNATLSNYNLNQQEVSLGVFAEVNEGVVIGDVLQSMTVFEDKLYLVVNNSGKIVVVDRYDFTIEDEIVGFDSPREMTVVGENKAVVTDLYSNKIYIVDLVSNSIAKELSSSGWTEGMQLLYGDLFVCNRDKDLLYRIDVQSETIVDSLSVGLRPSDVKLDQNDKLWLLTGGVIELDGASQLQRIDPVTFEIEKSFNFFMGTHAHSLNLNASGDSLFYAVNDKVYGMSISDMDLPLSALIHIPSASIYGVHYLKARSELYVSDANDYVQQSDVYRFKSNGEPIDTFKVGVNASSFVVP